MAAEHYCNNFREDGLHFNDKPITSMTEVQGFIKSKQMLSAFEKDPLIPFGIIMRSVHGHKSPTTLAEWFVPKLKKFGQKHNPLFTLDGNSISNGSKGKTHCVWSVTLKEKGDNAIDSISNALESSFDMAVRKEC